MCTPVYWLRSSVAYLLLALYIGVVGPPAILYVASVGRPGLLLAVGRFGTRCVRRLLGIRLQAGGLDYVLADRPSVYCINHRSNLDVIVFEALFPRCPRLRGLYKAELGRLPILGRAMRLAGFVPVERRHRAQAFEAVDLAAERLRAGDSFLIAPEGTRSATDGLLPFKKGGFVMAIKAQVPVVPVALLGTEEAMPRGRYWVKPTRVRVLVGEPVPTAGLSLDDRDRLVAVVRDRLAQLLRS